MSNHNVHFHFIVISYDVVYCFNVNSYGTPMFFVFYDFQNDVLCMVMTFLWLSYVVYWLAYDFQIMFCILLRCSNNVVHVVMIVLWFSFVFEFLLTFLWVPCLFWFSNDCLHVLTSVLWFCSSDFLKLFTFCFYVFLNVCFMTFLCFSLFSVDVLMSFFWLALFISFKWFFLSFWWLLNCCLMFSVVVWFCSGFWKIHMIFKSLSFVIMIVFWCSSFSIDILFCPCFVFQF